MQPRANIAPGMEKVQFCQTNKLTSDWICMLRNKKKTDGANSGQKPPPTTPTYKGIFYFSTISGQPGGGS